MGIVLTSWLLIKISPTGLAYVILLKTGLTYLKFHNIFRGLSALISDTMIICAIGIIIDKTMTAWLTATCAQAKQDILYKH